ncbi:MAG: prepilin-type N-terminal cleavage/methylation domain-containing protein [Candidatus Melainabacteria bacterium]|nr:prepilin-type N-terminal cleavage/methylation domain-containing protein [Candidatus Melainabacteria bacterium]
MKLKPTDRRDKGFTLIELLVCLIFVGVIVAMFFPAAFRHRSYCPPPGRVPRPAHCFGQANQHQLASVSGTEFLKSGALQ